MRVLSFFEADIIGLLHVHGSMPSYVVRNWLSKRVGYDNLTTRRILRAMKRLEARGFVKRVPSSYRTMIKWSVVQP